MNLNKLYSYLKFLFILFSISCSSQNGINSIGISRVMKFPISYTMKDGKTLALYTSDTISIYFVNDYVIYKLSPTTDFNSNQNIKGTEPYFIRLKNDKFGILYNDFSDTTLGEKIECDSFLLKNSLNQVEIKDPKTYEKDGFSSLIENQATGDKIEKYFPIKKNSEGEPDTVYYYFSNKFPEVNYALSKHLDSLRNMKFFKARILFKEGYSNEKAMIMPEHEIVVELLALNKAIPTEIMSLLSRFKKKHFPN